MKKVLNLALLLSFAVTIMVPLTGIHIHKLASVLFLLLSIAHTVVHRQKLGAKSWILLGLITACFVSGLFGFIFEQYPIILSAHRAGSIALVFFLAVHIYRFSKKLIYGLWIFQM